MSTFDHLSRHDLVVELDAVERAIARSSTFERYTDKTGGPRMRVSAELMALVEREQQVVAALRSRGQTLAA